MNKHYFYDYSVNIYKFTSFMSVFVNQGCFVSDNFSTFLFF